MLDLLILSVIKCEKQIRNDTETVPKVVDNAARHERGLTPKVEEVWKLCQEIHHLILYCCRELQYRLINMKVTKDV
jgi:hypothetical protein